MTSPALSLTSPTLHGTILGTIAVFVTILAMSFVFRIEVVARGQGRVVPVERVQSIQPEFAGRITQIAVRDGATVAQGDVLLRLDDTAPRARLATVQAEIDRLVVERGRIDAFSGRLVDPSRPMELPTAFPVPADLRASAAYAEELRLLRAEIDALQSAVAQLDARGAALARGEAVAQAAIDRIDASLTVQAERVEIARTLFAQGTASRAALLDVEQVLADLEGDRDIQVRELERRAAERVALETERQALYATQRADRAARRAEIEALLAVLEQDRTTAAREVEVTVLRAPLAGTVEGLAVFTLGGLAEAGQELMRIVPTGGAVEVQAVFPNQDIGFMARAQPVNIRLDAYPSERFGFVTGQVADLAADSTPQDNGTWGYVVRVTPDAQMLMAGEDSFALRPGMTATVDVTTDDRRIISYFFAPILRTVQDALGER
ncbi:HlyD family type I secretion periplasmic adaptor subunit [Jannaschia pagri]|uniref:Membrane fusion protein (MFP) family protein n=1 Tax=Jannaschia pagri TaxID=2829797 RepID=A0ABQ4NLW9_9RHOB|nr:MULTISPECIES: HlyD family type I secretion periplasmic adaptor subunit [unclassified Jannaschia]GIT91574.1 HlyD family type I secretion periplasmic adaptor subunit [Jannaschia sp. AI_61]GIT95408.1 HlyD family type I secretion periplasmic adaptor subunit [Jannaschia sp. AI_62]